MLGKTGEEGQKGILSEDADAFGADQGKGEVVHKLDRDIGDGEQGNKYGHLPEGSKSKSRIVKRMKEAGMGRKKDSLSFVAGL